MKDNKKFKFHPRCGRSNITHLAFADDLLLFRYADEDSVQTIWEQFNIFSKASGLIANHSKCDVYFIGSPEEEEMVISNRLGIPKGDLPFRYLGLPLSAKKLTLAQCKVVCDKVTSKL